MVLSYKLIKMIVTLACVLSVLMLGQVEAQHEPFRLPQALKPLHYNLRIVTNLEKRTPTFTFGGRVKIHVLCVEDTSNITLHSKGLDINEDQVWVFDDNMNEIELFGHRYIKQYDFYVIETGRLMKGQYYTLVITFWAKLGSYMTGYYLSTYESDHGYNKHWLAVTQFEPTYARQAFPCFDEPAMKATFAISLAHSKAYRSISNTPSKVKTLLPTDKDLVWNHFLDTPVMSTYLVAFAVTDFYAVKSDNTFGYVTFQVWCRKEFVRQSEFALEVAPNFHKFYEDYFSTRHVLNKQDLVAVPDFSAQAMENWGMITFRESALLVEPNTTSLLATISVASVIAHELAHQWFGNTVTMEWWTDLWLNEGFATYMSMLVTQHAYPEWDYYNQVVVLNFLAVHSCDSLASSHAVSHEIGHPSEIEEMFDVISYRKGALMLRMVHMILGEQVFRRGISRYLNAHLMGTTRQEALWKWFGEEAYRVRSLSPELSLTAIMDTWTRQPGYPLLKVIRNYETGDFVVTQSRFYSNVEDSVNAPQCWFVPITYTFRSTAYFHDATPRTWLNCDEPSSNRTFYHPNTGDEWVIFNLKITALYKVKYDYRNWQLILATLNSVNYTVINPLNRFQLVNDVFDLAAVGEVSYDVAFQFLEYLPRERSYLPWAAAINKLKYLHMMLVRTPSITDFQNFLSTIIQPVYSRMMDYYKFGTLNGEKNIQRIKLHVSIMDWACRLRLDSCVQQAKLCLRTWMTTENPDENNPVDRDLQRTVYCYAIMHGSHKDWEFVLGRYHSSKVPADKITMLLSLGCNSDPGILNRYLEMTLKESSGIRASDASVVYVSVLRNDIGFHLAKHFFMKNIPHLFKRYGTKAGRTISAYMKACARRMYQLEDIHEIVYFLSQNQKYMKQSTMGLHEAWKTVETNYYWHQKNYANIARILQMLSKPEYINEFEL